ncbi:MAG: hypothetical protein JSS43_15250 [Proteobacteria bacterium]|nr:hypothetical protein [Pseudomonadota bacterium]
MIAIWVGGLILAAVIYLVGPDQFLDTVLNTLDAIDTAFRRLFITLGLQVFSVVRALAIALYIVFVVLAIMSASRGRRGVGALIVVTIIFALLVWRPYADYPAPVGRWIIAFALVLVAAMIMTQRLLAGPPQERWSNFPPRPPA